MPLQNPQDVAAHSALDTGVHGVAASTVCSLVEVEAAAKKIATDTYTGDGSDDRQIALGFKCSIVLVWSPGGTTTNQLFVAMNAENCIGISAYNDNNTELTSLKLHATDGFRVYATSGVNSNGITYYYWAVEEE